MLFTKLPLFVPKFIQAMPSPIQNTLSRWEIFCRVVDNYGDIGMCWRLARALAAEYSVEVRLWVDDWATLGKLCHGVFQDGSTRDGVTLRRWTEDFPVVEPADVVIEAFACALPEAHVRAMAARLKPPVWINLEYLSAEDWVQGCHGLASPQGDGCLTKYFFFPGFTERTGGLIREAGLFARQARLLAERDRKRWLLETFGSEPEPSRGGGKEEQKQERWVSLFSYEQGAIGGLLQCWSAGTRPMLLLIPEARALACTGAALGLDLKPGSCVERGMLRIVGLPFMEQNVYDELLWRCELNFVRGEDSFVRAQWAARPLIWHIYPQADSAHLVKLKAFLAAYCAGLGAEAAGALTAFWMAWNGCGDPAAVWPAVERVLPELEGHARDWRVELGSKPGLVDALWRFCRHIQVETG